MSEAMHHWRTPCPECGLSVSKALYACPGCGADLREKCESCGLALSGEEPTCHCKVDFSIAPRSRRANKPEGGEGHGWLAARRGTSGY